MGRQLAGRVSCHGGCHDIFDLPPTLVLCSALEIVVNNVRFSERGGELEKITWGFRVEVQDGLRSSAKLEKR